MRRIEETVLGSSLFTLEASTVEQGRLLREEDSLLLNMSHLSKSRNNASYRETH